nr:ribosomal protein L22 [Lespedeza buergeri]UMP08090.1 ribosomal protein L22 [Lespedeza buergeri]
MIYGKNKKIRKKKTTQIKRIILCYSSGELWDKK